MVVVDVLLGISQGRIGMGRRMVGVEGVVVVVVFVVVDDDDDGRVVAVDVRLGISEGRIGMGRRMVGVEGVVVVVVLVVVVDNRKRFGYFPLIASLQNDHTNRFIRNN